MATALIVVDMQVFFASPAAPVLANVNRLIDHFHAKATASPHPAVVVYTQHGHTPEQLSGAEVSQLVRFWTPENSIRRYSPEWELLPEMQAPQPGDIRVQDKDTYDSFIHTDLEAKLRDQGVKRAVVCGVLTNFCCETTARSSFNRGFETYTVSDACGAEDQTLHAGTLRALKAGFGEVVTTSEIIKRL